MSQKRQVITQGEYAVSGDPDMVISTLLGSCVSCCLWDPVTRVGGMNHMLIARQTSGAGHCNLLGINAMELLINDMLKLSARRDRLRAKVFGGARMISGLSDIGAANAAFTLDFLQNEGITCTGQSLGGTSARQLMFWPATGMARLKMSTEVPAESAASTELPATGNDPELW